MGHPARSQPIARIETSPNSAEGAGNLCRLPAQVRIVCLLMGGKVANSIALRRQRVPMVDSSTLDDRTRPAREVSGSIAARLRYSQWMSRSSGTERLASPPAAPGQASPGRP